VVGYLLLVLVVLPVLRGGVPVALGRVVLVQVVQVVVVQLLVELVVLEVVVIVEVVVIIVVVVQLLVVLDVAVLSGIVLAQLDVIVLRVRPKLYGETPSDELSGRIIAKHLPCQFPSELRLRAQPRAIAHVRQAGPTAIRGIEWLLDGNPIKVPEERGTRAPQREDDEDSDRAMRLDTRSGERVRTYRADVYWVVTLTVTCVRLVTAPSEPHVG